MPNPEEHVNVCERAGRTIFRVCRAAPHVSLAADTRSRAAHAALGALRGGRRAARSNPLISAFILIEWPP